VRTLALAILLAVFAATATTRQLSSQSRAQQLAAAFSKHKQRQVATRGVSKVKYKDVRTQPDVKQDIAEYSGVYQVTDLGDVIELRIGSDGRIQAHGHVHRIGSLQTFRTMRLVDGRRQRNVRRRMVQVDPVPCQQVPEIPPVNDCQRIQPVNARHHSLSLDVRQAAGA